MSHDAFEPRGTGAICLAIAVQLACAELGRDAVLVTDVLRQRIADLFPHRRTLLGTYSVPTFNDDRSTTRADVDQVIATAIA